MAVTLEEVRAIFPNANHAPLVGCKRCGGTGVSTKVPKLKLLKIPPEGLPCICIFVDHDLCDFAAESLAETVRTLERESL